MAFYELNFQGRVDKEGRVLQYDRKPEQSHGFLEFDSRHPYFRLLDNNGNAFQYLVPQDSFSLEGFRGEPGRYVIEHNAGLIVYAEKEVIGHLSIDFTAGRSRKPVVIDSIGTGKIELEMSNIKSIHEMPLQ